MKRINSIRLLPDIISFYFFIFLFFSPHPLSPVYTFLFEIGREGEKKEEEGGGGMRKKKKNGISREMFWK